MADTGIGLSRTGGGVLNVTAPDAVCRSGGEIQDQGAGTMTCTKAEFSFPLPDPLRNLAAPAKPALAAAMKEVDRATGRVITPTPPNIPTIAPARPPPRRRPSDHPAVMCTLGEWRRRSRTAVDPEPGPLSWRARSPGGVTAYLLPGHLLDRWRRVPSEQRRHR